MSLRPPPIRRWSAIPSLDQLLLFAQALEEKLFDFSIDSYKARALNLHTSIYELLALGNQTRDGSISSGALIPVVEEFESLVKSDPVLSREARAHFLLYANRLANSRTKPEDFLTIADALRIEVDGFYWRRLLDLIRAEVRASQNSRKLLDLADTFIAEAELQGFHRSYIYFSVKRVFWRARVNSENHIDRFLDRVSREQRKFKFVFKATQSFETMREFGPRLGITMQSDPPDVETNYERIQEYLRPSERYPVFVIVDEIDTREGLSARLSAEVRLEALANIYTFHVHQEEPEWQPVALCLEEDSEFQSLLKPPVPPMRRNPRSTVAESTRNIERILEVLGGEHLSMRDVPTFFRALDYHRAALEATTPENQLVDLWAALEGFLPSPDPDTTRITHYVGIILPPITLTYAEKLFDNIVQSVRNCAQEVQDFVQSVNPDLSFWDATVCLLVAEEFEDQRASLFEQVGRHPLFRFRCHTLNEQFRTAKRVRITLMEHRQRVAWHLQRIYSTRNQIMHTARSLPYLGTLVENLHGYLDTLINSVVEVSVRADSAATIAGVTQLMNLAEHSLLESLKESDARCSSENFRGLVFGTSNPLSKYRRGLTIE